MKKVLLIWAFGLAGLAGCSSSTTQDKTDRKPNILWIFVEDLSPFLGCYGDTINDGHTPIIDGLTSNGVLFERAYATAPVCSASRSAVITGKMQTTLGVHHHRSSRTDEGNVVPDSLRIYLPEEVETIPEMMKEAGYFTFNSGKDDYNFHYDRLDLYDVGTASDYITGMNGWQGNKAEHALSITKDTWTARSSKEQPWFGQIELKGGKAGNQYVREGELLADDELPLPPYFPDVPSHREAWTTHFNANRGTDVRVEEILKQLKEDGELEHTVIFFFSDHGSNTSLRHKQFCYEGGMKVPLIISGDHPFIQKGTRNSDLVSLLDVAATTLEMGGVERPEYFDGQSLFSEDYHARDYVIGARDRCDFTIDRIRTVRTEDFRYIRNFFPERSMMQPGYRDNKPVVKDLKALHKEGKLTPYQDQFWFGDRPKEELYLLKDDPHQINNLAGDPQYQQVLEEHREILENWIKDTNDQGQYPEDPRQLKAVYDLWKDRPQFKGQDVNPEYRQFLGK
ncbi:phosphate ABC transporter substrate-binding protein [Echinicola strongylocentroti]|uniref:Phosphate ABC transporter substrate-binding protein n=1 Tax=Echinicola strongylocentroti TaxID=1795355 RepID=A0A2Z4IPW7_9BACT|nr:sulfatase [Echinicola strongylocentroti]AWW32877.1 phosphate ABC transporter substrate-binding protein [Echinicola strongylocentroti]